MLDEQARITSAEIEELKKEYGTRTIAFQVLAGAGLATIKLGNPNYDGTVSSNAMNVDLVRQRAVIIDGGGSAVYPIKVLEELTDDGFESVLLHGQLFKPLERFDRVSANEPITILIAIPDEGDIRARIIMGDDEWAVISTGPAEVPNDLNYLVQPIIEKFDKECEDAEASEPSIRIALDATTLHRMTSAIIGNDPQERAFSAVVLDVHPSWLSAHLKPTEHVNHATPESVDVVTMGGTYVVNLALSEYDFEGTIWADGELGEAVKAQCEEWRTVGVDMESAKKAYQRMKDQDIEPVRNAMDDLIADLLGFGTQRP